MATAETAIVIDVESEDENSKHDLHNSVGDDNDAGDAVTEVTKVAPCHNQNDEQEEKVQLLVQIIRLSRDAALGVLKRTDWNVEQAIARILDGTRPNHAIAWTSSCSSTKQTTGATTTSATSTNLKLPCRDNYIQQNSANVLHNPSCDELSKEWHSCYENAPTPFVDPDFPPTRSSLDGRSMITAPTASASGDSKLPSQRKVVKCYCGILAASKKVQSDGPNYGKFYLACGRSNQRKRPHNSNNNDASAAENTEATNKTCKFFQWDKDGSVGGYHSSNHRWSQISWHPFIGSSFVIAKTLASSTDRRRAHLSSRESNERRHRILDMGPDHIRQGALGNCWFLSALAVVAEQPNLLQRVFAHSETNEKGCYQVNLCLDGKWTPTMVDAYLPVVKTSNREQDGKKKANTTGHAKIDFRGVALLKSSDSGMAFPAFCAVPRGILWPALIEKAYAKAHGSYANLSGGFIAEGLADLTGAPTETVVFEMEQLLDPTGDELWVKMLSFSDAGFIMGVATNRGGDGLVGCHAYSVLKVLELHGRVVGAQPKLTSFFSGNSKGSKTPSDTSKPNKETMDLTETSAGDEAGSDQRQSVRLVRIRNPWGKKEWTGAFSSRSENWTKRLRKELGQEAWSENDGTFWMPYHDVVSRFHHMDVCKTRVGWLHRSVDAVLCNDAISSASTSRKILSTSSSVFQLSSAKPTWAFFSLIQPKKRANIGTGYWYSDLSMFLLKRSKGSTKGWRCEAISLDGVTRRLDKEIFLDPSLEYCVIPFAGMPVVAASSRFPYRLTVYSSHPVHIQTQCNDALYRPIILKGLHNDLLKDPLNATHMVSANAHLICAKKRGCLYFLAVNNSKNSFLCLLLNVNIGNGTIILFGKNGDTHDVAPESQKILLVVASNGKRSTTTEVKFKYISDEIQQGTKRNAVTRPSSEVGLGSTVDVSFFGSSLASDSISCFSNKGEGSVDVYSWIHQVGSMTAS
ncbi:unnamed protein product [Cylindrotheca closterium]|uniref:Calpain catalytic domain-containing protein n=1 Tax=Cylindrotheca closterium TaxID=2856 RepID=A0AAD2CE55_9STRA|nr:unnamed protein product [Cylindrotheca closterium]